jgi:hypothetical protein
MSAWMTEFSKKNKSFSLRTFLRKNIAISFLGGIPQQEKHRQRHQRDKVVANAPAAAIILYYLAG